MRKFKIGESVLIRTDLAVGQVYRTNNGAPQAYFAEQMTIYKGKKIINSRQRLYRLYMFLQRRSPLLVFCK